MWHLNLYFIICFVFPVWENRLSRAGKNAYIPPSNYLDWDGIASLFKSNSRGWAPNNTYYMPPLPPKHLWFILGLFASSNPFQLQKLGQNLDYNGERKNQSVCWDLINWYLRERDIWWEMRHWRVRFQMPLGDLSRLLLKSVPKLPGLGSIMTFGKRDLEQQLKLLGKTVLDKFKLSL